MTAKDVRIQRRDILSSEAQALSAALNGEVAGVYPEDGATPFRLDPSGVMDGNGALLVAFRGSVTESGDER